MFAKECEPQKDLEIGERRQSAKIRQGCDGLPTIRDRGTLPNYTFAPMAPFGLDN